MVTAVGTAIRYFKAISADRYEIFKKLHELKLFFNENLISQEEYEREVALIKNQYENEVENETKFLEEEKAKLPVVHVAWCEQPLYDLTSAVDD